MGVLIVAEHAGLLDPVILATVLTRPVRMVMESSGVSGRWGPLSKMLDRIDFDPGASPWSALAEGVRALTEGEALGMFVGSSFGHPRVPPPGALAAYVHARTAVPVVPVTLLGSHGTRPTDPPLPRSTIEIHVGPAVELPPLTEQANVIQMRRHSETIRQVLADATENAVIRTGRSAEVANAHNGSRD